MGGVRTLTFIITRGAGVGGTVEKSEITSDIVGNPSDQVALGLNVVRLPNANRPTLVVASVQIAVDATESGIAELLVENANPPTVVRAEMAADSPVAGPTYIHRGVLVAVVPSGWRYEVSTTIGAGAPTFTLESLMEYELV